MKLDLILIIIGYIILLYIIYSSYSKIDLLETIMDRLQEMYENDIKNLKSVILEQSKRNDALLNELNRHKDFIIKELSENQNIDYDKTNQG